MAESLREPEQVSALGREAPPSRHRWPRDAQPPDPPAHRPSSGVESPSLPTRMRSSGVARSWIQRAPEHWTHRSSSSAPERARGDQGLPFGSMSPNETNADSSVERWMAAGAWALTREHASYTDAVCGRTRACLTPPTLFGRVYHANPSPPQLSRQHSTRRQSRAWRRWPTGCVRMASLPCSKSIHRSRNSQSPPPGFVDAASPETQPGRSSRCAERHRKCAFWTNRMHVVPVIFRHHAPPRSEIAELAKACDQRASAALARH